MAGFKTIIILYFAHHIYDSWNVFSSKIWLVKTSTRIMIHKSWVFKSHPILLSMLMILVSILCVIRHLICGHNLNWLLNLYLIYETLWTLWVNSHYKAWKYKKKKHKKITAHRKWLVHFCYWCENGWVYFWGKIF